MAAITGSAIDRYQLAVIRAGVRLEAAGMKRSKGRSSTAIAKDILGTRISDRNVLIAGLTFLIELGD